MGETFDNSLPEVGLVERAFHVLSAAAVTFGVVFLAELGDRSQLMAMTYALRYRWWKVLAGIAASSILVHGISVIIGHSLGSTLPERPIALCGGLTFLIFAIWTWRENSRSGREEGPRIARTSRFEFLAIVSSFLLAELGDKTMLATVALASERPWAGVWLGSTIGMVCADAVAIVVGALLHRSLPAHLLQDCAAVLFAIFGSWMVLDTALGLRWVALCGTALIIAAAVTLITARSRSKSTQHQVRPAEGPSREKHPAS